MHAGKADFTLTFRRLAHAAESPDGDAALTELFEQSSEISSWLSDWRQRLESDPQSPAERAANMRRVNPAFIPRNHRVEAALTAASEHGDIAPFHQLLAILQRPFDDQPEFAEYEQPAPPSERAVPNLLRNLNEHP